MNSTEALASGQDVTVKPNGDCELAGVSLPGLPEGLLLVGYREPTMNEAVLFDGTIRFDLPKTSGPQLIIKSAQGYRFKYDIQTNEYFVVKLYDVPKRITARFDVRDVKEEEEVVRSIKGLVSFKGID